MAKIVGDKFEDAMIVRTPRVGNDHNNQPDYFPVYAITEHLDDINSGIHIHKSEFEANKSFVKMLKDNSAIEKGLIFAKGTFVDKGPTTEGYRFEGKDVTFYRKESKGEKPAPPKDELIIMPMNEVNGDEILVHGNEYGFFIQFKAAGQPAEFTLRISCSVPVSVVDDDAGNVLASDVKKLNVKVSKEGLNVQIVMKSLRGDLAFSFAGQVRRHILKFK